MQRARDERECDQRREQGQLCGVTATCARQMTGSERGMALPIIKLPPGSMGSAPAGMYWLPSYAWIDTIRRLSTQLPARGGARPELRPGRPGSSVEP